MLVAARDVVLRTFSETDRDAIVGILTDNDVMRLVFRGPMTGAEANAFVDSQFARERLDGPRLGTIEAKADNTILGFGGYLPCTQFESDDVEFGFAIATPHHGKGHATRLGVALMRHAFQELPRERVIARCHPHNEISKHLLLEKFRMSILQSVEAGQSITIDSRIWFYMNRGTFERMTC